MRSTRDWLKNKVVCQFSITIKLNGAAAMAAPFFHTKKQAFRPFHLRNIKFNTNYPID
jgi:hypothetical protein